MKPNKLKLFFRSQAIISPSNRYRQPRAKVSIKTINSTTRLARQNQTQQPYLQAVLLNAPLNSKVQWGAVFHQHRHRPL